MPTGRVCLDSGLAFLFIYFLLLHLCSPVSIKYESTCTEEAGKILINNNVQ